MRIKKVSQTAPLTAQVIDGYSESQVDGYSCNYVNDITTDEYSTNEVQTNKKWIDNKPIYRKVFEFSTSSSNVSSWTIIASISDLNIESVVEIGGAYREGTNNYWHPINYYESTSTHFVVMVYGNNLTYQKASGTTVVFYAKIILEYTKTTD